MSAKNAKRKPRKYLLLVRDFKAGQKPNLDWIKRKIRREFDLKTTDKVTVDYYEKRRNYPIKEYRFIVCNNQGNDAVMIR